MNSPIVTRLVSTASGCFSIFLGIVITILLLTSPQVKLKAQFVNDEDAPTTPTKPKSYKLPLIDAVNLAEAFNRNDSNTFYAILAAYTGGKADTASLLANFKLKGNTILYEYLKLYEKRQAQTLNIFNIPGRGGTDNYVKPSGDMSYGTGFSWNKIADGLSQFVASRIKQEMVGTFFLRLQRDFTKYKELQVFFPSTYQYVNVLGDHNPAMLMDLLHTSIKNDINNIPRNVPNLQDIPRYKQMIEDRPQLQILLTTGAALGYLYENREHPAKIIELLPELPFIKDAKSTTFQRSVNTLAFVSKALKKDENTWASKEEFDDLENTDNAPILLMGLMWQRYGNLVNNVAIDRRDMPAYYRDLPISGGANKNLITMSEVVYAYQLTYRNDNLNPVPDSTTYSTYNLFKPYFKSVLDLTTKTQREYQSLAIRTNQKTGTQIQFNEILPYLKLVAEILEFSFNQKSFGNPNAKQNFAGIASNLLNLYQSVEEKEYSAAVANLSLLLATSLPEETAFKREFLTYGLFMANVANARSSNEVRLAIEAIAVPPGSTAIKRTAGLNISLNAFAGPFYAAENLLSRPSGASNKWGGTAGLTTPVGICISTGLGKAGSVGVVTSLLDIGSLVSFRMKDPSAQVLPQFKLQNILAPGIYAVYGVAQLPLALGFGVQYGPQLREITLNQVKTSSNAYRMGAFVAIDIPMFNFYTRMKE
ncbi:MAG: hypothetical protein IPI59_15740 [Sphingobacteriales bacterium]|jgi:hypothetical protein|nr:hypothetical protein [Sphingobacteriales bacterium]MBP9141936.1 hypothetical protein [Chitinophagales bacterium]MDA0199763.1 hypothetical protein [Bacteroidota bacterium]MBK6888545.1 hypothetical protein [Sphingobacteriales bacterium]MBK7528947.1 hypothetical protein [Sphingobacteriales bacterium]